MSAAVPPTPSLPDRLGLIVESLRRALAPKAAKDRALAPLVLVLWNRLSRIVARFAAVAARHPPGSVAKPPKPRKPRQRRAVPPPPPRDQLPRQRGWLSRRVPECNVHGEYLRILLEDPETRALLEAAPQLRRLLRPLWRMLRIDPPPPVLRTAPAASSTSPTTPAPRNQARPSKPVPRRGAGRGRQARAPRAAIPPRTGPPRLRRT